MVSIVWFRQDLRLADNPALTAALERGATVALYILDEETGPALGGASKWWLHHSLAALNTSLGGKLILRRGPAQAALDALIAETDADAVFWNRLYEPTAQTRDAAIKTALKARGIEARSFGASLLAEPWEIATKEGGPYQVFTPFWRGLQTRAQPAPLPAPRVKLSAAQTESLESWALVPTKPDWAAGWSKFWTPGERGARKRFEAFLKKELPGYVGGRDHPDQAHVSRLSPHLHFGEISPRQLWSAINAAMEAGEAPARDAEGFLRELGWRDFSYHLLHHFPELPSQNWRKAFDHYPWRKNPRALAAWKRGRTGYPIVDAGMRELWATGYMHNRVRMIVASFLIKHLGIDWREGAAWFWDTLVDADLANNSASWQWVAGSGADASPYFRIFNPVTQGKKFDPDGVYVRRWVSELAKLPDQHIHTPAEAPAAVLAEAGVVLGKTYPRPIIDLAEGRAAALAGYDTMRAAD